MALLAPEVASELKLTDEQKQKLNAVNMEFAQKQRDLFTGGGGGGQEAFTKLREERFGSRTNSLASLAATESVQKHLGITGDAVSRLNTINDEYRAAIQKEYTALGIDYSAISDLPAAERAVEMRKASENTTDANRKL